MECILCGGKTSFFKEWRGKVYLKCSYCKSLMVDKNDYVSLKNEKERYEEHNNDINDKRYQNFVSPIVDRVLKDRDVDDRGLDFGSGTGPVITKMLSDKGYDIKVYDPFFANYKERLEKTYDYIVCCEVMEHFHNPKEEFKKLKGLLNDRGSLYLMTEIYDQSIDFYSWNYKNDQTHVFFYHRKALEYIKDKYRFKKMDIVKDMIVYNVK